MGARDYEPKPACPWEDWEYIRQREEEKEVSEPSPQGHEVQTHGWKERDDAHSEKIYH